MGSEEERKPVRGIEPPGAVWGSAFRRRLPRVETVLLFAGLAVTIGGKAAFMLRQKSDFTGGGLFGAVLPDFLFFVLVALVIRLLFVLRPSRLAARCRLVIVTVVFLWSVLNVCWLTRSGAQLQPGILVIFVRDLRGLWPFLRSHLKVSLKLIIVLLCLSLSGVGLFVGRFVRPGEIVLARREHLRWAAAKMVVVMVLLALGLVFASGRQSGIGGEVLGFSSHWHALVSSTVGLYKDIHSQVETRNVPRVGEREVLLPECSPEDFPNVVLVLLESVPWCATPLSDPNVIVMPYLANLARQGAEFTSTHVPVAHTTKAYWAILTGSAPVIEADYVEAVPVEAPYEGLASILARAGYSSAFFEMSKGSFECTPGFFSNQAFDWVWFRENLKDESAHLGYLAGDDCRMIEPAMEWLTDQAGPALLMMITSVSHDPFEVPRWFAEPAEELYDRYVQSLEYTDHFLEQVCNELKERGLEGNTVLCVLGDHGTSFRSKTNLVRWYPYEEIIRVPWLIRWPGHIEGGMKFDWPCSQLDVTPTLLNLLGFDIDRAGFEGRDAFVRSDPNRRMYFSSWYSNSPTGFLEGRRKVVYWPYIDKVFEYDLAADPDEENPCQVPSVEAKVLKRRILDWQGRSQIVIDPRRYTESILYSYWRTFSAGRSAWAYYVP